MQTWVRTMPEREVFSVQIFFDQLILIYDNFPIDGNYGETIKQNETKK